MKNFSLLKFNSDSKDSSKIIIEESGNYYGIFIGKNKDFFENELNFIHQKREISSNIIIKAILYDESSFNLRGNLVIEKGAKLVDSYLKIDVLMLSPKASTQVIPALEIMETDVKGGHGATVGQIDKSQKFYLMSKGISEKDAENLIVKGFLEEILAKTKKYGFQNDQSYLKKYFTEKELDGFTN